MEHPNSNLKYLRDKSEISANLLQPPEFFHVIAAAKRILAKQFSYKNDPLQVESNYFKLAYHYSSGKMQKIIYDLIVANFPQDEPMSVLLPKVVN